MVGPAARSAAPSLAERLNDPDPDVRVESAVALAEIQREKAIPDLRGLLKDGAAAKAAAEMLLVLGEKDGLPPLPDGSSSFNVLRNPAICEHLNRSLLDKDVDGSVAEVLLAAAEQAGMCAELTTEAAALPRLTAFRRIHATSRKRSVLELLRLLDVDFVLDPGIIKILSPEQAKKFWADWRAEHPKK
jgi:hypothetical protein